jgi:hypothetical protein
MDSTSSSNRLMIFTNDPSEAEKYESEGWYLSQIYVLRFYPSMNPDLLNRKLYGLFFWRPEPKKQPELL